MCERKRASGRCERAHPRASTSSRAPLCARVCVCKRERKRERVCVCERESVFACVCERESVCERERGPQGGASARARVLQPRSTLRTNPLEMSTSHYVNLRLSPPKMTDVYHRPILSTLEESANVSTSSRAPLCCNLWVWERGRVREGEEERV